MPYAQGGGNYCPPGAMGGAMGGPMGDPMTGPIGAYDGGYNGMGGGYGGGGGAVPVPGGYAYPGPVYAGSPGSVAYGPMAGGPCGYPIPRQYYRMRYCVPQGMQYPPANQPPAVVQYPYYTTKGPDCFFYTGK